MKEVEDHALDLETHGDGACQQWAAGSTEIIAFPSGAESGYFTNRHMRISSTWAAFITYCLLNTPSTSKPIAL